MLCRPSEPEDGTRCKTVGSRSCSRELDVERERKQVSMETQTDVNDAIPEECVERWFAGFSMPVSVAPGKADASDSEAPCSLCFWCAVGGLFQEFRGTNPLTTSPLSMKTKSTIPVRCCLGCNDGVKQNAPSIR